MRKRKEPGRPRRGDPAREGDLPGDGVGDLQRIARGRRDRAGERSRRPQSPGCAGLCAVIDDENTLECDRSIDREVNCRSVRN